MKTGTFRTGQQRVVEWLVSDGGGYARTNAGLADSPLGPFSSMCRACGLRDSSQPGDRDKCGVRRGGGRRVLAGGCEKQCKLTRDSARTRVEFALPRKENRGRTKKRAA